MAKVIFRDNQPIQSLSGTYGRTTFRVINGKTVAHIKPRRHQADDSFNKADIIDRCVADIQLRMHDMREAIADRRKRPTDARKARQAVIPFTHPP